MTIIILSIVVYLVVITFFFSLLGNLFFKKQWREFFVVFFIDFVLFVVGIWHAALLGIYGFLPALFLAGYACFCFVGLGGKSIAKGV